MRIVAGAWRGRRLAAPAGETTRPTSERARAALFDMLLHAPWGGRGTIEGARVLDAFAGTGALGLEALSRGAAHATFVEQNRAALTALRANVAAYGAPADIVPGDALALRAGPAFDLAFLDPPYGRDLAARMLAVLQDHGRLAAGAMVVVEFARAEPPPPHAMDVLADRSHGAARLLVLRAR